MMDNNLKLTKVFKVKSTQKGGNVKQTKKKGNNKKTPSRKMTTSILVRKYPLNKETKIRN